MKVVGLAVTAGMTGGSMAGMCQTRRLGAR